MSARRFLFAWRHALASAEGPKSPTDRLVALTLSLYMNGDGMSAWPSQPTIAIRCALTPKSVRDSLARLCSNGWLSRIPRKSPRGKRHKRFGYEYRAMLPKSLGEAYAKGERRSLFKGTEPAPNAESAEQSPRKSNREPRAPLMGNDVPPNTSVEYFTKSMPSRKRDLPLSTESAQQVQKRRAARDEFVAAYDREQAKEVGGPDER